MSLLPSSPPPGNLCELFLRDVASLLVESRLVRHTLPALRPQCEFSPELTTTLDAVVAVSASGESHLRQPLVDAGAVLPATNETTTANLVTGFFGRLPPIMAPGVLAAEVAAYLRLLVHHLELKSRLAAEEALLVGQHCLGQALAAWEAEWQECGRALRAATVRARAQAYIADLGDGMPAAAN